MKKLILITALNLSLFNAFAQTTAFQYSGRLVDGGVPVNGYFDLKLTLYDLASGGTVTAGPLTNSFVFITNGLFAVSCDFGSAAFDGSDRWMELSVRTNGGVFTNLAPRQAVLSSPYAIRALSAGNVANAAFIGTTNLASFTIQANSQPAFTITPTASSPNLTAGYSGNVISNGFVGSTISGGGESGNFNKIGASYATISGGANNSVTAYAGTVGGGINNVVNTPQGTVAGGGGNQATANSAVVGGGIQNLAAGNGSTVAGGKLNTVTNNSSTIGGGYNNYASGVSSTVAGGETNTATGIASTIAGGFVNSSTGPYSTVAGGREGVARLYGQQASASGRFAAAGDAQTSLYVLRNTTAGSVTNELFLDGGIASSRLTIPLKSTWTFDILIVGRDNATASAAYSIRGCVANHTGTGIFIGTPSVTTLGESDPAFDAAVEAGVDPGTGSGALLVKVTGVAAKTLRWVARVQTTEVTFP
jgi:hypothetical protein